MEYHCVKCGSVAHVVDGDVKPTCDCNVGFSGNMEATVHGQGGTSI